jgi:uncharacterized RDD family membrane protein YckC
MSDTETPAGWYPSPTSPGAEQYWDGNAWTDQLRPPTPTPAAPMQQTAAASVRAGRVGLPAGVAAANPWMRLLGYVLEIILITVTLGIGWLIWAATTASNGQTPAKKLLKLRVIGSETIRPVGFGKMFWMRGILAGFIASIAISLTLGVLIFMPFWDKRNQNIWDKISGTYVVTDEDDAWGLNPDLR